MRALCAFELALILGRRRYRSRLLLLTDVVLLRHLRRSEDVLLSLIHTRTLVSASEIDRVPMKGATRRKRLWGEPGSNPVGVCQCARTEVHCGDEPKVIWSSGQTEAMESGKQVGAEAAMGRRVEDARRCLCERVLPDRAPLI